MGGIRVCTPGAVLRAGGRTAGPAGGGEQMVVCLHVWVAACEKRGRPPMRGRDRTLAKTVPDWRQFHS